MAKENGKETKLLKRVGGEILKLNTLANNLMNSIRGNNVTDAEKEVDQIIDTVQKTIHRDFNSITDISRRSSSDMYSLLANKDNKNKKEAKVESSLDLKDFFEADDGALLAHFKQRHRNRAVYLDDLYVVSTQMHELTVALNVTRDSIITSDNMTSVVSRTLHVSNSSVDDSLSDDKTSLIERIQSMEDAYDLNNRIKDHIVPNTLRYGTYYAYVIPYADLFNEMNRRKQENFRAGGNRSKRFNRGSIGTMESLGATLESQANENKSEGAPTYDSVIESTIIDSIQFVTENVDSTKKEELVQTTKDVLDSITIDNEHYPPFLLEEDVTLEQVQLIHARKQKKRKEAENLRNSTKVKGTSRPINKNDMVADGSRDTGGSNKFIAQNLQAKSATTVANGYGSIGNQSTGTPGATDSYDDINGAYFKLLDTRRVIPIHVMDDVIGYYYIHRDESMSRRRTFSGGFNMELTSVQSLSVEEEFMSRIAEQISNNLSLSFLKNNTQFKESIAKALIYNDAYQRNIHFQFIPAEYMQEFNVNEDEEGRGQSMLQNSVFYAKLYLAVLLFKIMIIISRSADQRLLYVRSSGFNTDTGNRIQSIAREFKRRELSFTDLLSYNAISTKVGQGLDMYIPLGTDDKRGIDFEVLPGQDVQLHTELLEMLRNNAIIATDTPTPLVDTVQQVDFAKQISQSNIKHANHVVSYQGSFNRDITSMYKMIMKADGGFEDGEIESFKYTLLKPSALNTMNAQEIANNAEALVTSIVEYGVGKNGEDANSEESNQLKDILGRLIMEDLNPNMHLYNKYLEQARIIQTQENNDRKRKELAKQDGDGDGGDNY